MKKDIADKWVAALRSGKYKQGKGTLRDSGNNFCCLGVLCDILDIPSSLHVSSISLESGINWSYGMNDEVLNSAILPNSALLLSEIKNQHGDFGFKDSLVTLNDNGSSFMEIADVIEKNWESL